MSQSCCADTRCIEAIVCVRLDVVGTSGHGASVAATRSASKPTPSTTRLIGLTHAIASLEQITKLEVDGPV